MAFANIERFLKHHENNKERDRLRLGQRFCNLYIKQPWPELFYDVSEHSALQRILTYLADHQYVNAMPPEINTWQ